MGWDCQTFIGGLCVAHHLARVVESGFKGLRACGSEYIGINPYQHKPLPLFPRGWYLNGI